MTIPGSDGPQDPPGRVTHHTDRRGDSALGNTATPSVDTAHPERSDTGADELWVTSSGAPDGSVVVLVHGTLDRSAGLVKLARRLGARFRVIRYDRRGYGRSADAAGPYSVARNVDDLLSIIDAVAAPVALFGHSFGGNLCLAAAQARPDAVRAVAVYESPLSWRPDWFATSGYAEPTDWSDDPALAAERFMRRLIGDAIWERLPAHTRHDRRAEGVTMVDELTDLRAGAAPWEPNRIATAVLAMYGEDGLAHHRRAMEIVASEVANAIVVEVAAANHFGPNTRPDAVAEAVGAFFAAAFR